MSQSKKTPHQRGLIAACIALTIMVVIITACVFDIRVLPAILGVAVVAFVTFMVYDITKSHYSY